jgi:GNAT superfamily N-acetyltransferase
MTEQPVDLKDLHFKPVTSAQWKDFQKLFGSRGACGGCWCMWWRMKRSEFDKQKGEGNKKSMKTIIDRGEIPGLIAYVEDEPVGWCSVAPRETFQVLDRSRILKRVDEKPVWSIVCFFVSKPYRRKGISLSLIKAAVDYAGEQGASIVEGYPIDPKKGNSPDVFAYTGLFSAFKKAGFVEVCRRSETRPIMRYEYNSYKSLFTII